MENPCAVYMSLWPEWAFSIKIKDKDFEFRNKLPAHPFNEWFVYVTVPEASLKYVCKVGAPIEYGTASLLPSGVGNYDFNDGVMTRFAIPVLSMDELEHPIPLARLRSDEFHFSPPQFFAYDSRYPELTRYIHEAGKRRVF